MKSLLSLLVSLGLCWPILAADPAASPLPAPAELGNAIERGLAYLRLQQQGDGSFANPENGAMAKDHPALTALPIIAFQQAPGGKKDEEVLQKGYAYVRSKAQPDGGIYSVGLSNYNTSVALMALLGTGDPKDEPMITKARNFVAQQQAKGMAKAEVDGGFGYGPTGTSAKRQHPDLDNTLVALEALHAYHQQRPQAELAKNTDLNFQAAIDFVSRCQNLPATNSQPWASGDTTNKGGFIYYPGASNAGEQTLEGEKKALRSYGTMSYAGLLSFIYAELPKDDQRVVAALDWLTKNYSLEENPGMGRQGIFYYYNLAVRGLSAAGFQELTLADGRKVNWRAEIAAKLLSVQAENGSWVNDQARWMEKDPVLVTTYCVLALEQILAK